MEECKKGGHGTPQNRKKEGRSRGDEDQEIPRERGNGKHTMDTGTHNFRKQTDLWSRVLA
eukprot:4476911-Prorocentrum_lima.AAC.1